MKGENNWMEFFPRTNCARPGPPYECMYTWGGSSNMSLKNIKVFFLSLLVCCYWNVSRRLHIRFPTPEQSQVGESISKVASVFTTFCYYCVMCAAGRKTPKKNKQTKRKWRKKKGNFRVKSLGK